MRISTEDGEQIYRQLPCAAASLFRPSTVSNVRADYRVELAASPPLLRTHATLGPLAPFPVRPVTDVQPKAEVQKEFFSRRSDVESKDPDEI